MNVFIIFLLFFTSFLVLPSYGDESIILDAKNKVKKTATIQQRYRFYRWMEDYSDVTSLQRKESLLSSLKHINLGKDAYPYLSVGGDYRFRSELSSNQSFGLEGEDSTDVYLNRFMVHGDMQWSDDTRTFLQFSTFSESGRQGLPRIVNDSELDIHQAFLDRNIDDLQFRLGRQEIVLDSGKLLGTREGPNQRRSFDAIRLKNRPKSGSGFDLFAGREVQPRDDAFRDSSSHGARVWGIYGSKLLSNTTGHLDAFYVGVDRDRAFYDQGRGAEKRHTLGLRLAGQREAWRYNYEGFYQFGEFNDNNIQAWSIFTENYLVLSNGGWSPTVGLRANIASGDNDPNDEKLGTFDALFPVLPYLSDAGTYTPRNLYELQGMLDLSPRPDVRLRFRGTALWRQSTDDAIYVNPGRSLISGNETSKRYIGYLLDAKVSWSLSPNVKLETAYIFSAAGSALKDVGGKDTHSLISSISVRF